MVEVSEGISPCFSASAAVAGLIQLVRKDAFPRNACVVVNLTGGDRPVAEECPKVEWIDRTTNGWTAPPPADFISTGSELARASC